MAPSLEKINSNFTKKISPEAARNQRAVQEGMAANEALKELESHDTGNKEKFSTHEPTEKDWDKIKKLQTRIKTWTQYLEELSTIDPNASSVVKALEQEHFNLSELPETPETEKTKKDLENLIREYEKKRSIRKQETDNKLIKKITDEIADMQK